MNQESYDALIAPSARVELAWWLKRTLNANGTPVHLPPSDMSITTDASKKGWGAAHQSFSDQWQMIPKRFSATYQLSRAKGVLSGLENLSQRQVSRNRISANRQHDPH